jgi:hypothetical protein
VRGGRPRTYGLDGGNHGMNRRTGTPRGLASRRHAHRGGALLAVLATVLGLTWTAPVQAASSYQLKVSSSADRSSPLALAGHRLAGRAYVFLTPTSSIKSVAFYLDDPKRAHKPRRVDSTKPFDFAGGTSAAATPCYTTALRDGRHTLTAVVTTNHGRSIVVSSAFTTSNPTPAPLATAAKPGNGRVTLTWASGGGSTKGFDIYRSTTSTISYRKPINAKPLAKTKSSYTDRTAKNGTTYHYVVRAVSTLHRATSGAKVLARPLEPPKRPASVLATSGDRRVKVTWSNAGGTVRGWRIYRGTTSSVPLTTPVARLAPSARSFTDIGLTNGDTVYYVVQAYADAFSAAAGAVPGTPIPAPDTLSAAPDDGKVTVGWSVGAGATAITGFRVYVGTTSSVPTTGTPAASISNAAARSRVVTHDGAGHALINNTQYFFRVVSISATGKAPSASAIGATPVPAPDAPTSLTATASSGQILVTWVSTGKNTLGYNVFRANGSPITVPTSGTPINASLIDRTSTSYPDLSVAANTTYTYVVVAVGASRTANSPTATAKTPSVSFGPTASGWGGQLSPTNLDWPAGPIKSALGTQLTDFHYVFNRIGTTNVDKTATLHVKPWSDLTLTNHGGTGVTISSLQVTGPYSIVFVRAGAGISGSAVSFPHTMAAGEVIHIEVQFDYCRTGCSPLPVKGVQYGTLIVNSNDPGHTVASLPLAGAWQATAGGADELPLATFVNQVLGITTRLTGGTDSHGVYKGINYGNGLVAAVGDEVLSPYWRATGGTVSVRQVIATHTQGGHEPLQWYAQGNTSATNTIMQQAGTDYQTLLPGGSNGPRAEGSFGPGGTVFGFRVNSGATADWSDNTLNTGTMGNDIRHGCPGPCGHHVRFYPLRNASGPVANTYLMCVDSQGVNLDFNDVDYIISGITPA